MDFTLNDFSSLANLNVDKHRSPANDARSQENAHESAEPSGENAAVAHAAAS